MVRVWNLELKKFIFEESLDLENNVALKEDPNKLMFISSDSHQLFLRSDNK